MSYNCHQLKCFVDRNRPRTLDHTTSQVSVESGLTPHAAFLIPFNDPIGLLATLQVNKMLSVKSDLAISTVIWLLYLN